MITILDIFNAYYDCRKNKRNTYDALEFEQNLENNLMNLYYELINNTYKVSRSLCFAVLKPKPREIWAASFKDRIVHHLIYNKFYNEFQKNFIFDNFAYLPNKGTLYASNRLENFIRSSTNNYKKEIYFLKADIDNFFVSINKNTLFNLIKLKVKDIWWQNLIEKIIFNDCTKNCIIKSSKKVLSNIPSHKSLFNAKSNCGLPIGNLSSQFFANIYLNELDQYAKHKLKIKYYIRYVDDIVILNESATVLNEFYNSMNNFLNNHLQINFKESKKLINKTVVGINFVGYIIKPYRKYIRKSIINNIYNSTRILKRPLESLNSYFGLLKHAKTYKQRIRIKKFYNKFGIKFNNEILKVIK
jgi:hypothetical protein